MSFAPVLFRSDRTISPVKEMDRHSEGFAKGELHVNEGAYEALSRPEAVSLLRSGCVR